MIKPIQPGGKSRPDSPDAPVADTRAGQRKPYCKPTLRRHGEVRGITLGGSIGLNESPGKFIPGHN
jgi:hypothetical protein